MMRLGAGWLARLNGTAGAKRLAGFEARGLLYEKAYMDAIPLRAPTGRDDSLRGVKWHLGAADPASNRAGYEADRNRVRSCG